MHMSNSRPNPGVMGGVPENGDLHFKRHRIEQILGCNNGGGGGNFSKVKRLVAERLETRKRLF